MADQMAGSGETLREGLALLTRMHLSHNALPDNAFNALPATAQRYARLQGRAPLGRGVSAWNELNTSPFCSLPPRACAANRGTQLLQDLCAHVHLACV